MVTTYYTIGALGTTPVRRNTFLNTTFTQDVYRFSITGTRNINLHLFGMVPGDDADISLYRDNNGNGVVDGADTFLQSSAAFNNYEDNINYQAGTGRYLAVVNRFALGPNNFLSYNLNLSATDALGASSSRVSNLLPNEVEVGNLNADRTFTQTLSAVNNKSGVRTTDVTDTYHVEIGLFEGFNAILTPFNGDADLRVVRDLNNNRTVEANEIVGSSINGGTLVDRVNNINLSDDYYIQVYRYNADTGYRLTIDHFVTPFP